jgi:hypothetical protein
MHAIRAAPDRPAVPRPMSGSNGSGDDEMEETPSDGKVRPDYDSLKELARQLKRPATTLIAMTSLNDPFYAGVAARRAQAEWFVELWNTYKSREGMHLRGVHYILISQGKGTVKSRNLMSYENTINCWQALCKASRDARLLGLVPADAFEDRRNSKPITYLPNYAPPELSVEPEWIAENEPETLALIDEYPLPEHREINPLFAGLYAAPKQLEAPGPVEAPEIPEPEELPLDPEIKVESEIQPPFWHLEIWCEKTTMNHVLEPLAHHYKLNLITASGFESMTHCMDLIARAERSRRPVRIFYISDLDLAGRSMPTAVARMIEFLAWYKGLDIELRPIALTHTQCVELNLPRTPIKDSVGRNAKAKFEERFSEGATELDALEALHPGYLRDLLVKHIERYQDPTFRERAEEKQIELEEKIEEMRGEVIAAHPELDELRDEHSNLIERRNEAIEELLTERLEELNREITELTAEPINELNEQIDEIKGEVEEIDSEIKEQVEARVDRLNEQIVEINEAAGPLYAAARELAQTGAASINRELEQIEDSHAARIAEVSRRFQEAQQAVATELKESGQSVIDAFEWPKPVAAVPDDEPLFDSKRPYLEQIEHYAKHSGKLTERKRFKRNNAKNFQET